MDAPTATVIAAIVAATASICGAIVALVSTRNNTRTAAQKNRDLENRKNELAKDLENRKNELNTELENRKTDLAKELEDYKDTLAEQQEERNAWREYRYEARKRLYQQYEPLLFQLVECCESAKERIHGLARTASLGNLEPGGWLSGDSYYVISTIYYLLSPLVVFKLMQRLVTFVDLTVDPYIKDQYLLAKQLAWSFTDAFSFAEIAPKIDYDPDSTEQQREQYSEKYWRRRLPSKTLLPAITRLPSLSNGPILLRSWNASSKNA